MLPQEFLYDLPLMADRRSHNTSSPHRVYREGGSNLWVLEYALDGIGFLKYRSGDKVPIQPGTFFMFRADTYQNYGMDKNHGKWEHCYATFTPREHWHEYFCWPQLYRGAWMLQISGQAEIEKLQALFFAMIDSFAKNTQRREDFLQNDLERLFLELDMLNPLSLSGRIDQRIRDAMEYIRHNFRKEMTIDTLAMICRLSPSRFSHLFLKETGTTPMKYLESQRLENARALLTMTSMTVEEIAYECGFNNAFYFSRQFKKSYYASPRNFRMGRPSS